MSKVFKLKNVKGKVLHKMTELEIREMVIKQTDQMLESIPKDVRVAEINAVKLESSLQQVADVGVWAEWTRACCSRRNLIEDFTDPAGPELGITDPAMEKAVFQNHFDSNFSIRQVTEEASLKKIKARGK